MSDAKDDCIYIRCTTPQKRKLKRASKLDNRSLSNYVLISALNAAEEDIQQEKESAA
jgi:uncharacterized protein (DUF1778 family)